MEHLFQPGNKHNAYNSILSDRQGRELCIYIKYVNVRKGWYWFVWLHHNHEGRRYIYIPDHYGRGDRTSIHQLIVLSWSPTSQHHGNMVEEIIWFRSSSSWAVIIISVMKLSFDWNHCYFQLVDVNSQINNNLHTH